MFVDGYEFKAYNAMGLKKFTDQDKDLVKDVKLSAPDLGSFGAWWNYIKNAGTLAPIEKGSKGVPEGVLRLGATFVVNRNDVVYQWNDRVPGDHPDLNQVLRAAQKAAQQQSIFRLPW